jgi:hypothetical protein
MPASAIENAPTINANLKAAVKSSKIKGVIVPKAMSVVQSEAVKAHSILVAQISSAVKFSDLPHSLSNPKSIKTFRATCYHAWMISDDPFDGFSLESTHLLGIVRTAFTKTFVDVEYVPKYKDIFHQTVSVMAMSCFDVHPYFKDIFEPSGAKVPPRFSRTWRVEGFSFGYVKGTD